MGNESWFTVIVAILTIIGSVVGVWAVGRKNVSDVQKAKGLSEVTARNAETKERSDLLDMLKEGTRQGAIWLEALKIIEANREKDYATLKAIIEDGTQETINSRKELLKSVAGVVDQAVTHNTGITTSLGEVLRQLGAVKTAVDKLPAGNDEMKQRIDVLLGYIDRLLPKLRITTETSTVPVATPNGTPPENPSPS